MDFRNGKQNWVGLEIQRVAEMVGVAIKYPIIYPPWLITAPLHEGVCHY